MFVDGSGVAPLRAAMFLPRAFVAPGGEVYADAKDIGGDKKEDSLYTVLTPLNMKRIIHRRRQSDYDFGQSPGYGRGR
jgi:hypothetical protein